MKPTGAPGNPVDREAAIAALVAARTALVELAAARVESRAAAEDLVQEAMARAVERLDELRDGAAVLGWFKAILRNAIVDHYRRRGARARALERMSVEPEAPATEGPDREPAGRICPCVGRLAGELRPAYADALRRVEVEGASLADLAGEAGITAGNAAVRVHRARAALARRVAETCGACAEAGCTDCGCARPGG